MSYDFAIWKRSADTKTAMLLESYEALSHGDSHPAMQGFNGKKLEKALKKEFDYEKTKPECMIALAPGSRDKVNWMMIHCNFPDAGEVTERVLPIVLDMELMLYDPQRECVWGNKRPRKT